MMDKIYVVDNYDREEMTGFTDIEAARKYLFNYYVANIREWYGGRNDNAETMVGYIAADLENLQREFPFIEEIAYIREVKIAK